VEGGIGKSRFQRNPFCCQVTKSRFKSFNKSVDRDKTNQKEKRFIRHTKTTFKCTRRVKTNLKQKDKRERVVLPKEEIKKSENIC
jgi:hypothetical protein